MLLPICFYTLNEEQKSIIEKIYEQHGELMLRTAKKYLSDQSLAEDVLQRAFEKIISDFDNNRINYCNKTAGYFVIMVRNLCMDSIRRRSRENIISTDAMDYEGVEQSEQSNPECIVLSKESHDRIMEFIDSMEPIYREALLLRLVHNLSGKEMSELLGVSEITVNARVHRGRKLLIEKIQKEVNEDDYRK